MSARAAGKLTPELSGHLGGVVTASRYGHGYMKKIGRRGGRLGGRPRLRTLAEIEAETRGAKGRRTPREEVAM